jgi:succinate dehydrogenase/fumarate reductase flavoprotein subunit
MFEIENILHSATVSATASLERKETRWGSSHRRADYPERNDAEYLCHIVLSKAPEPFGIECFKAPLLKMDQSGRGDAQ